MVDTKRLAELNDPYEAGKKSPTTWYLNTDGRAVESSSDPDAPVLVAAGDTLTKNDALIIKRSHESMLRILDDADISEELGS